jgi:hypothetical protein
VFVSKQQNPDQTTLKTLENTPTANLLKVFISFLVKTKRFDLHNAG